MKRVIGLVFLLLAAFAVPSFGGGNVVRDLGEGLFYLCATAEADSANSEFVLPGFGSSDEAGQAALVLDLRYAAGGAHEAEQLGEWLNERAAVSRETAPIFFLVNAETSPALHEAAAQFAKNYPALRIGPAADGGSLSPDIVLPIDAEEERAAYAALASGETDIAALIDEGAANDKRRYDEAAVIAAHAASEADAELSKRPPRRRRSDIATDAESTETAGNAALARPVDLALQRAIHLYRAWRVF